MSKNLLSKHELKIFLFFVLYVFVFGLILQKLIIPMTPWHAGNGLMSAGDWIVFQELAIEHVGKINANGWHGFDWRPGGQGPAGFAAAIYVLTGINEPWILLPFQGIVYALAALGLFGVMHTLSGNERIGLLALAPLVFMPSLAMVWGQIHKDLWVISSLLLLLAYWVKLFMDKPYPWWLGLIVIFYVNSCMVWMRPYALQIILVGQCTLLPFLMLTIIRKKNYWAFSLAGISIAVTLFAWNLTNTSNQDGMSGTSIAASTGVVAAASSATGTCKEWSYSLPIKKLDNTLMSLACTRDGFNSYLPNAKSNLDVDVEFSSAIDIFLYGPRALQIGILAPFPDMWFSDGSTAMSKYFRLISAVEVSTMYVALIGIASLLTFNFIGVKILDYESNMAVIGIVIFSFVWVGVYALTTGNVGSIYRMRFPVMLIWMGLGFFGWSRVIVWWRMRGLYAQS
jgi:hypothetical protein